ncbi:MAG TPA: hypothetical protein VMW75_11245, partial [Thermoanaerobaculia bacterium]|nr:hypothetical protein [Thermoanaerobaculia bacterium]
VKGEVDRARVLDLFKSSSEMYRFWGDIAPRNQEWTVRLQIPFERQTSLNWKKMVLKDYEPKLLSLGVVGKIAKALIVSLEEWVGSQIPSATVEMSRTSGLEHLRLRLRTEGHVYGELFKWVEGESLDGARFFREMVESIGGTLEAQQKGEELAVEVEVPAIENFSSSV